MADTVNTPEPTATITEAAPVAPTEQPAPRPSSKPSSEGPSFFTTGRRKEAIARVRMFPGTGRIVVNNKPYDLYFPREAWRVAIRTPLVLTHLVGKQDVFARVNGGGASGQAGAIRLGISRAILQLDPAHKATLRTAGLLTRDPRMKERKKYGQKGARKRFQWTKR